MKHLRFVIFLIAIMSVFPVVIQATEDTDSLFSASDSTRRHRTIFDRLIDYLDDTNKEKPYKRVDFSFLGGPFYSNESKFGIGLVASGIYRPFMGDSVTPPSIASLYGQITTTLCYSVGINGTHIGRNDNFRFNYDFKFRSFPTAFWGIGFDLNKLNTNKTKYKDFRFTMIADATWRIGVGSLFIGPAMEFACIQARDIKGSDLLWDGQHLRFTSLGLGVTASLDTRDNLTAPQSGWLLKVDQKFFPRFLHNSNRNFSMTEAGISRYNRAWQGAVIATRLHGRFTYGHTPWGLLSSLGGSYTMRGYWEDRYRDKCAMDLTVELRQRVYRRSGIVVWGGVGAVFPDFGAIRFKRLLPNGGIGYRWEFKRNSNVRIDFGFGRGETAFVFNINEAF